MKPTLLVLAAGMGSRFGGLKQMEPVGPSGEWILDYSVHDARKAGFGKIVFVIRKEMERDFVSLTQTKYGDQIEIAYAFQEITDTPVTIANVDERQKPWGTGHAVYAARNHLESAFAVINADDFYAAEAFSTLAEFLSDASLQAQRETYALVAYRLSNTLSEHGTVSRGVCRTNERNEVLSVEEHSDIGYNEHKSISAKNASGEDVILDSNTPVSLNCWGFPSGWAMRLEPLFEDFLRSRGTEPRSEFYLPAAVDTLVVEGKGRALALPCQATWLGVTHREDLQQARDAIAALVAQDVYPSPLKPQI